MRKIIATALAGLAFGLAAGTAPQADDHIGPPVACEVAGYDVIIYNPGTGPIPAGIEVRWSVPFARMQGSHALADGLEPGKAEFLTGALESSYLDPDTPCLASFE